MRIGLVLNPYGEREAGGLGKSIEALAGSVLAENTDHHFLIYTKGTRPSFPGANWQHRVLGRYPSWLMGDPSTVSEVDVMVYFTPVVPLLFPPRRRVVIIHDLAYLEMPAPSFYKKFYRTFLRLVHASSARRADTVACVSEYTKQEVERRFGIPSGRMQVIYNGILGLDGEGEPYPIDKPFFLFAGVLKERKNVAGVIRAFALCVEQIESDHVLVIAGKGGGRYHESLLRLVEALGLQGRVVFAGYVAMGTLRDLYERAEALVFPSHVEGFGMPILEAMRLGCPVITSNSGALAEVAGPGALLVDPKDPADIARAMLRIRTEVGLREALKERGYTHSYGFSWERSAKALLAAVEDLQT